MAPRRPRPANKHVTKGKRQAWKKGQSSSYNPKSTKFRDEAKHRSSGGANSFLTQKAVAYHNKIHLSSDLGSISGEDVEDDTQSAVSTEKSFVSTFSNCSNPAFDKLLQRWQSNSSLHKEMLAVLAAVTDVIKQKGGKETETEYFAALMTTLDIVDTDEARTAALSLLLIVIRRIPQAVLQVNFSKTCPILKDILLKYADSDYNALLRNTLGCLFFFLKAQRDPSSWTENVKDIFSFILGFIVHHKPKVRKSAQSAIVSLLKSYTSLESNEASVHPATVIVSQFCVAELGVSDGPSLFHILNILKNVIACFPRAHLKTCCEAVLRVMTLGSPLVVSTSLKALLGMFQQKPKFENLSDELNVKIIKALYDYQPNINDTQPLIDWLMVLASAFANLYGLNPSLCMRHLPDFFKRAVPCFLSDKEEVHPAVGALIVDVISACIIPSSDEFQQLMLQNPINNAVQRMFQTVESALSYQYFKAWKQVLTVIAAFFSVAGKHCYSFMVKCLQSLADLRDTYKFPHTAELDKAIGIAIQRMGPKVVLKAVPLQLETEENKLDFPRSWLLPLLRDNVRETELGFFIKYFLPLISRLRERVMECEAQNKLAEAKTYDIICTQVWSLLPGFCIMPTDLKTSFRAVARTLGEVLNDQKDLRITVLSALRNLISKSSGNEENIAEVAKFAKNYLPIMFNLYTTESKDKGEEFSRLAVFSTIKEYLTIADRELCCNFFVKIMEKLKDASLFTQQALLDIAKALTPYISEDQLRELYEYCKPSLRHVNHTVQKKSYGVINEICSAQSTACVSFIKNNMDDLKSLLLTTLSSSSAPAKAMRLSCLKHIVGQLGAENKEFIVAVVPEAVLCTKENAVKTRTRAFELLVEIGNCLKRWAPDNPKCAVRDYFQILLAGFAGNPHMMSATLLSIAQVTYEFRKDIDTELIHMLVENTCLLLTSRSREVVDSGLSYIKTLFTVLSTMDLAQHVEPLVNAITSISQDNQRHFRFKAKELFTRLIRKFGYEMISKFIPEQFQKQLTNIRKLEARKARKRYAGDGSDDDDEEDDEAAPASPRRRTDSIDDLLRDSDDDLDCDEVPVKNKQKGGILKKSSTWIAESADKEIVDFMDPTVTGKILAAKPVPASEKKKKAKVTFDLTEDGRIIIPDGKEDTISPGGKRKRDSNDEIFESICKDQGPSKKRKKSNEGDSSDEDEGNKGEERVVLKGIHRILDMAKRPPGAEFKAKKAGGDIKKGKIDPYAYIPFNSGMLNKRKKKKLEGQFKGIAKAAKRGAQVGFKKKSNNMKKRMKKRK